MLKYRGQEKILKLFVIPSIEKPLILGIDFWKEFKLVPGLTSALQIEVAIDIKAEAHIDLLNTGQRQQLEAV